jgi:pimeloyl-ACP methyl ester carboxylesterase
VSTDIADVLLEGPWTHRFVAANGARFHVAEAGEGPLVVLLHGFPQFWWAWRNQIPALAEAGFRVAAMDLRGYAGSDKPPRGYDTPTLAADVAGVVRALGHRDAVVIGHDWGGWVAWAMPALQPQVTRAVAVLSAGHPLTIRAAMLGRQLAMVPRVLSYQVPWLAERRLVRGGAAELITAWWGDGAPQPADLARYQRAMRLPSVAHTSTEYFRWALTATTRRGGRQFVAALSRPITVPMLQMHGAKDPWILPHTAAMSRQRVEGPLNARTVPGAGHFLPEEAPTAVTAAVIEWLTSTALRPSGESATPIHPGATTN